MRVWWLLAALVVLTLACPAPAAAAQAVIQSLRYDAASETVVIRASAPLRYRMTRLTHPDRLVLDLPGARFGAAYQELQGIPGTAVRQVRGGQFQRDTARVVFDLSRAATFPVTRRGSELHVAVGQARVATPRASRRSITDIGFSQGALSVVMSPRAPYWSHTREGAPTRHTLVFPGVRLAGRLNGASVPVESDGVQRWRARQVGDDAHVELELDGPPRLDIRPSVRGWRFGLRTIAATPRPPVVSVPDAPLTLRKVGRSWQLTVSSPERFSFQAAAEGEDRIVVDLEGARLALPRDSVYIDNGLIARVRMTPVGGATRLTIDLDQPVRFSAQGAAGGKALALSLSRVDRDRVTVDPGHGGADHGAMGPQGTREKDVTFAIAKRLSRLMEAGGMSVQMTRLKDVEILLRPRVEMANRNGSDVYISIHANSYGNKAVRGIETYYFADASYPLAKAIQKHLVASLKQPDRGVRKNNFYVVNHSRMPAALVEIGYLTNAEEEKLLRDADYQEKAAQAIYNGVKEWMDKRGAKP